MQKMKLIQSSSEERVNSQEYFNLDLGFIRTTEKSPHLTVFCSVKVYLTIII